MNSLRPPGLGPIVGHTTDHSCRIWIRAGDPADSGALLNEDRRTVGVIGLVTARKRIGYAAYFRLQREFDRTGTFLLGEDVPGRAPERPCARAAGTPEGAARPRRRGKPLTAETVYRVRVGTLTIDDPMPDAASLPDWQLRDRLPDIDGIKQDLMAKDFDDSEAVFRTFPPADATADRLTFLIGSCRYPGLLWKVKEADRIFGPMLDHFTDRDRFGDAGAVHAHGRRPDLRRHAEPPAADPAGRYLRGIPVALPRGLRRAQPAPAAAPAHHLHDPRRPRDRGQLDPGPAPGPPASICCSTSRSAPT